MRPIKFRVWDEKYNSWDKHGGIIFYPERSFIHQGRVFQQYTGMIDENGKEIYEGDIITYNERMNEHGDINNLTAIVIYVDRYAAWGTGTAKNFWNLFSDYGITNIRVIGNIFENADLIKDNNEKSNS